MSAGWQPDEYINSFDDAIMQLVEQKARQGEVEQVQRTDDDKEGAGSSNVLDLTELLKRSLAGKEKAKTSNKSPPKTAAKKSTAKTPRKKAAGN